MLCGCVEDIYTTIGYGGCYRTKGKALFFHKAGMRQRLQAFVSGGSRIELVVLIA
jgi:hypothetical protein